MSIELIGKKVKYIIGAYQNSYINKSENIESSIHGNGSIIGSCSIESFIFIPKDLLLGYPFEQHILKLESKDLEFNDEDLAFTVITNSLKINSRRGIDYSYFNDQHIKYLGRLNSMWENIISKLKEGE